MLVAASSGLALTMAASSAVAAPESDDAALPDVDVQALSNQTRAALNVSPSVTVPADIDMPDNEVEVEAIPPKTTDADGADPLAEHVSAEEREQEALEEQREEEALEEQREQETASRDNERNEESGEATTTSADDSSQESTEQAAPSAQGGSIVDIAFRYVGTPYVWGGADPSGFDCSGFTWYVYQQAGISIPRSSSAQRNAGTTVSASEASPGDLVWWPGHVGIYLGDGQHIAARNPSKPLQAGPISHVGRGEPTYIRVG